jgi:hypothetical protein
MYTGLTNLLRATRNGGSDGFQPETATALAYDYIHVTSPVFFKLPSSGVGAVRTGVRVTQLPCTFQSAYAPHRKPRTSLVYDPMLNQNSLSEYGETECLPFREARKAEGPFLDRRGHLAGKLTLNNVAVIDNQND